MTPITPQTSNEHPPTINPHPQLKLRIYELMAERNIRSVAKLHRMLIERQIPVSHSQLLRIANNRADHWRVEYINAFMSVFNCSVSELFKVE